MSLSEAQPSAPPSPKKRWRPSPRQTLALILCAGALTFIESVRSPFLLDDYMHEAMVEGRFGAPRGPLDLYNFVNDDDRSAMVARGLLPWWTHPQLTIRFFRPLSSLVRFGELRLLHRRPLVMHLHSLAWWAAAVLAARALFRRTLPARPALLATVIFALGPWHVLPLAWLANREALLSLCFGTIALDAHHRYRQNARPLDAAVATALFSLALLAGEYALCFGGYVIAIELVRRKDSLLRRALGPLPFLLPAIAYLLVRSLGGYGAHGSAFYSDPMRDPMAFLHHAPTRFVTLLAESWLTLGTEAWGTNAERPLQLAIVLTMVALLTIPLWRMLQSSTAETRTTAIWLLLGSLGSLVPVLAAVPSPRLLGASAIGMAGVVALLLDHAWFPATQQPRRGLAELTVLVGTLMGFLQLVHGPASAWIAAHQLRLSSLSYAESSAALRARIPDPAHSEVVVVRGAAGMLFGPFTLDPLGASPAEWRILAQNTHVLALRRGPRTLEIVVPPERALYPTNSVNLFRSEDAPLFVGDKIELPGLRIEILEVGERGPRRARYTFDRDLEDPSLSWIEERSDGFFDARLPSIGFGLPFDP